MVTFSVALVYSTTQVGDGIVLVNLYYTPIRLYPVDVVVVANSVKWDCKVVVSVFLYFV